MAHHEQRLMPGDPAEGPLGTVNVYVDDEGNAFYPGQEGYVEPEAGNAEFLNDFGQQLSEDQHRVASGQAVTQPVDEQEATIQAAQEATDTGAPQQPAAPNPGQPQPAQQAQPQQAPPSPAQQPQQVVTTQEQQAQQQTQAQPTPRRRGGRGGR